MSFIQKFNELIEQVYAERKTLGQCLPEYLQYLEYVANYFRNRSIYQPIVVEIGTLDNCQERFYENLLGAQHIGIELSSKARGNPEIIGDSRAPETIEKLKTHLAGRQIDLLFLDGNHTYEYVKYEYENYGALTKHIIAFHDLLCTDLAELGVHRFWKELCETEKEHCLITFYRHNSSKTIWPGHEMGIGLVVKE